MTKIPLLLILLLIHLHVHTTTSTTTTTRSALLALSAAVRGRTLLWNTSSPHCTWPGILCTTTSNTNTTAVTAIHLPGFSLSGPIPPNIFTHLPSLISLSLRYNHLTSPLPADLAACARLRILNLAHNSLSGPIPANLLSNLTQLTRLTISNNAFSGGVPLELKILKKLKTLYLENNLLVGVLPELKLGLEDFNVSFNNGINGSVPVSLSQMQPSSFLGTRVCGKPLQICPGIAAGVVTGEESPQKKKKGLSGAQIAVIVIGGVVAIAVILMIIVVVCGKKKRNKNNAPGLSLVNKQLGIEIPGEKTTGEGENGGSSNGYSVPVAAAAPMASNGDWKAEELNGGSASKKLVFFGNGVGGKIFDLEELLRASAEVLGKGTFGTAYKAVLEMGTVVAVKRLKDVTISEREFREKIEVVGAMNHENLVPLRAYYYSRDEKLLVYDYMPTGSLSAFLHGNKGAGRTPLNWEMRSSIALGAAHGISYLHSQGPDVSHGNIKSSNILLTSSNEPRVSDFGLAHIVGPSSTPTRANGYRAPEVTDPRKVSQKGDVYSFGVLLLELLTGKAPTHSILNEEGVDLPRWVQSVVKDDWTSEVFDLELLRYQHAEEEMVQLLELAVDCTAQHPDSRPLMPHVAKQIEELCSSSLRGDNDPQPTSFDEAVDVHQGRGSQ